MENSKKEFLTELTFIKGLAVKWKEKETEEEMVIVDLSSNKRKALVRINGKCQRVNVTEIEPK